MQTEVFLLDFKNIRTFVAQFGRDDRSAQVGGSERIAKVNIKKLMFNYLKKRKEQKNGKIRNSNGRQRSTEQE
jgi:hypothetical protein